MIGLLVSALESGLRGPDFSTGQGNCVVFMKIHDTISVNVATRTTSCIVH